MSDETKTQTDGQNLADMLLSAGATWIKQREKERRKQRAAPSTYRRYVFFREPKRKKKSIKDLAAEIMEHAYLKASNDGKLWANARQIFYAARPYIQAKLAEQKDEYEESASDALKSGYFTQNMLPDYMNANPTTTEAWRVAYDPRGHFYEPHSKDEVGLGTIEVDKYLRGVGSFVVPDVPAAHFLSSLLPTHGPKHRYGAILFVEKEGFSQLFKQVDLANRYDIAVMSCKGQSVTAARRLADKLCHRDGIPLLTLHDFDVSGFYIQHVLHNDTERYQFDNEILIRELGLRLEDAKKWNLEPELVAYNFKHQAKSCATRREGLFDRGATEEEVEFLIPSQCDGGEPGQRVELNAFTSEQFVAFIESKLALHGIEKVVPDQETLEKQYRRAYAINLINRGIQELRQKAIEKAATAPVPTNLLDATRERLRQSRGSQWDGEVSAIAENELVKERDRAA